MLAVELNKAALTEVFNYEIAGIQERLPYQNLKFYRYIINFVLTLSLIHIYTWRRYRGASWEQ